MVVKRKKSKDGSSEDLISQLPESLILEILSHLPTKVAVQTSALSTKWRNLWQSSPALDLDSVAFPDPDAFVSFAERFINSHREESSIRKLRLSYPYNHYAAKPSIAFAPLIEAVIMRRIQYLDVVTSSLNGAIPLSIYTCGTLVELRLRWATLGNAEFVSLPCLKIMHLKENTYPNEAATLEKLISGSPVLEDLAMSSFMLYNPKSIQVRSQSLTRIYVDHFDVVIDAPLLKCFRTKICSEKRFKIVNLGFSTRLDIDIVYCHRSQDRSFIRDILTDISKVKDLVVSNAIWKDIFRDYPKSRPLLQFHRISRLNAKFSKSDLKLLPNILESCPLLEYLILKLGKGDWGHEENREPLETFFTTVPKCLVSSLRFVELKRLSKGYEGVMELARYFLKNSRNLEKLQLNVNLMKKSEECAFFKEMLAMRRCSSACEVVVV